MFDQSDNMRYKWEQSIRESTNCDAKLSTYECLDRKTAEEIVTQTKTLNYLVPVADDDFFANEVVSKESYDVSKRQEIYENFKQKNYILVFLIGVLTSLSNKSSGLI